MYFNSFKFETGFLPIVLLFWLFLWGAKPLRFPMDPAVLSTRKREFFWSLVTIISRIVKSHNYFFWWLFSYTMWVEMNFCSGIRNMRLHLRAKLTASSPFYCLRIEERYKLVFSHNLMLRQLKLHSFLIANYWSLQTTIFHQVILWKWSLWLKLWQTLFLLWVLVDISVPTEETTIESADPGESFDVHVSVFLSMRIPALLRWAGEAIRQSK